MHAHVRRTPPAPPSSSPGVTRANLAFAKMARGPLSPRTFGLAALLRRRLQRGLEGGPLLLCALVIEKVAPGPALERPRHGLVAPGDVGVGGPLLRVVVVHEVLAQLENGVRQNDDATEEVRDL